MPNIERKHIALNLNSKVAELRQNAFDFLHPQITAEDLNHKMRFVTKSATLGALAGGLFYGCMSLAAWGVSGILGLTGIETNFPPDSIVSLILKHPLGIVSAGAALETGTALYTLAFHRIIPPTSKY